MGHNPIYSGTVGRVPKICQPTVMVNRANLHTLKHSNLGTQSTTYSYTVLLGILKAFADLNIEKSPN